MRTISVLIAAFSSLIFVLTSAFPAMSVERFPLVFHDDGGTTIQLPAPAKRIVALYGAFNDMLLEMELGNRIVARTKADTRPELAALPVIGTHMRPNFEKVAALHPDLILQFEGRQEAHDQVQRLRALGLKVAVFLGANFADMFSILKSIGVLTGEEAKAEACVAIMQKRLAAVAAKREGKKRPRIFLKSASPICSQQAALPWLLQSSKPQEASMLYLCPNVWLGLTKRNLSGSPRIVISFKKAP